MQRHGKVKHGLTAPECKRDQSKYACFLQSWTTYSQKYLVMNRVDSLEQEAPLEDLHPVTEQENTLRLEAEEEARLLEEQTTSLDQEVEHNENTGWLRGCKWPKWFLHKPLHIIVAAAALLPPNTTKDVALGLWQGFECVSPAKSERIIWRILEASKIAFQCCEVILNSTLRVSCIAGALPSSLTRLNCRSARQLCDDITFITSVSSATSSGR
jgi:hypothetical protein